MNMKKLACATLFSLVSLSGATFADDTELYVINASVGAGVKPNVLIIFDNSGSMSTLEQSSVKPYEPGTIYPPVGSSHSYSGTMVYWNSGGIDNTSLPTPDSPSETRRFLNDINGCETAKEALITVGFFTGFLREYRKQGKSGSWNEVRDNSGANYGYFDCWEDVVHGKPQNASVIAPGYPANVTDRYNFTSSATPSQVQIDAARAAGFGSGKPITLYTDNYLRWYTSVTKGEQSGGAATRLEIAKGAISNVFNSMSSNYNLGLAVFNMNYDAENSRDGGRIISGIKDMSSSEKDALISTISKMPAETNTPLCETLFEAYQYLSGGKVVFGDKDSDYNFTGKDKYIANQPPRDLSIEAAGQYISPLKVCPEIAYVIYITDGVPTLDHAADDSIKALLSASGAKGGIDLQEYPFTVGVEEHTSYLPALAAYMFNNDIIKGKLDAHGNDNQQSVRTYTIGFSAGAEEAEPLLKEAAVRGGGNYSKALDAAELTVNLTNALSSILAIDSSFTSPSIANNNFDRTQTFDSAYYAMFLPGKGPRWSGNLKKLKVSGSGILQDANGDAAISGDSGNIADNACTYWTASCVPTGDGNDVLSGGVLDTLAANIANRKIYTNNGGMPELKTVSSATLATEMGIDESDVPTTVNWLYGYDVDDDDNDSSRSDARVDIMGDPLHSKPLALNFGSKGAPDVRIFIGTNQGLFHMFKDTGATVSETWAFLPAELSANVPLLRENKATGDHSVYGMDSSPVAYTAEADSSGKVTKAWVYTGMRRGGSSYYAFEITQDNLDSQPTLKWVINAASDKFDGLGQSWSEPVVTRVPGHDGPVLIFGGGYDSSSSKGNFVYVVDADTGKMIHPFTDTDMLSVPNKVAVLDSNNDGVSDRIYAADIGGNVWRMDMPEGDMTKWTQFKFASLGGSGPSDRHFFVEPSVAQTTFTNITKVDTTIDGVTTSVVTSQNVPYDAVTLGTGNRTHPLDTTTEDMFFVLQDRNVISNGALASTLTLADLYDVTSAAPASEAENLAFGKKLGWYYNFSGAGEKSLSASLIFGGKVFFTSFTPPTTTGIDVDKGICGVSGKGRLYELDLHKGIRTYSQLYYELGERVPDTPQIVVPDPGVDENKEPIESSTYLIGVGKGQCTGNQCTGTIKVGPGLEVNKIYYHINE
jgi:type IV pilus assembly protein PilY1